MKKWIALTLALAMVFSLTGCGCEHQWQDATCTAPKTCSLCGKKEGDTIAHTPGDLTVSAVDTQNLTMTHDLLCSVCGAVMETKESATGIAPVGSVIHVSPDEWCECLSTNIKLLGVAQALAPYPTESYDESLIHGVVSMTGMMSVFSFYDDQGNAITTQQRDARSSIHNIRLDGQFTNDSVREFLMLLMVIMINNNQTLEYATANELCNQIMSGAVISDNGYTYAMQIVSPEDHTVCVSITAQ